MCCTDIHAAAGPHYVRGKRTLHSEFESGIPLATLDPNFDRLRVRNRTLMAGIWMALVSFVTWSILTTGLKMSFADTAPGMVLMIGVAGLIFSAATFRKVQFFRFKNQAGVTVLDLARSGKHAAELDAFIDALVKQIEVARSI